MAFQPVVGSVQCAIRHTLFGQQVINTMSFYLGSPSTTQATLNTLAAQLSAAWATNIMPRLSSELVHQGVTAYSLDSSAAPVGVFNRPTPLPGGANIPSLPGNVAFCCKFLTGGRGRTSRGRIFIGGLPETSVAGNTLLQAEADLIVTGLGAIRGALATNSFEQIVISRYLNGVVRPSGAIRSVSSAAYSNLTVDSQRRRLTGRGV